jgi:hypothetical protein
MPARIGCQGVRPELVSTYCEIPLPLCIGSLDRKLQQRFGIAPFSERLLFGPTKARNVTHNPLNSFACPVRMRSLATTSGSRLQSPRTYVPPNTMPSRRGNM